MAGLVRFPRLLTTAPVSKISLFSETAKGLPRISCGGLVSFEWFSSSAPVSKIRLFSESDRRVSQDNLVVQSGVVCGGCMALKYCACQQNQILP